MEPNEIVTAAPPTLFFLRFGSWRQRKLLAFLIFSPVILRTISRCVVAELTIMQENTRAKLKRRLMLLELGKRVF